MIGGRESAPTSHYFYRVEGEPIDKKVQFINPKIQQEDDERAMILELQVKGQVVVTPSVYDNRERCVWHKFGEPATIDADILLTAVSMLAVAVLVTPEFIRGRRHWITLGLSAAFARAGLSRKTAQEFFAILCEYTGDDELSARLNDVDITYDAYERGGPISASTFLRENAQLDERIIKQLKRWLGIEEDWKSGNQAAFAEHIRQMVSCLQLFRTIDGEVYVTFPVAGKMETQALQSLRFQGWVRQYIFDNHDLLIETGKLNSILSLLYNQAEPTDLRVHLRVADGMDGFVYIDTGNPERQAIRLSKDGWDVVTEHPILFRSGSGSLPLSMPERGGRIEDLRQFINVASDADFLVVITWMTWSMLPFGPYAILVLNGEQGSGKSFATVVIRNLIDPNSAIKRSEPRDLEALTVAAYNSWMIDYDNLSSVKGWLADALCRLATEGGFATRRYYTNLDEVGFSAKRPILLNSIVGIATQPDLLDRSLVVELPRFGDKRREETEMMSAFNEARGKLRGALLDVICKAMGLLPEVKVEPLPRMAGFAKWGVAVERAMGLREGAFMRRYNRSREEATLHAIESSSVAQEIINFIAGRKEPWTGKPGALFNELSPVNSRHPPIDWPRGPKGMADALKRLAPILPTVGVCLTRSERTEKNGHVYTIRKTELWDDANATVEVGFGTASWGIAKHDEMMNEIMKKAEATIAKRERLAKKPTRGGKSAKRRATKRKG